ncbi:MAG: glycine--tRNA ligase subunit beta, partial [Deltaproteobacteria bacterium]|nr:glycine--tRNA ligase subunit beta [Deltaproteobacteria bacterium]
MTLSERKENMVAELLLEIGTEEIPSGYLEKGLSEFRRLAEESLKENRIDRAGGLFTFGTPRRLVLIGKAIAEKQEDLVQEVTGPPVGVAYDEQGRPTKAAQGFARKQGLDVNNLERIETPKGEYLFAKRHVPGRNTAEILEEVFPELISRIPWPKSMRWGTVGYSFVRPIHWVVALFGGKPLSFDVAGVRSGDTTRGHRFMAPDALPVYDVEDYLQKTRRSYVLIDQKEREDILAKAVVEAAASVGGIPSDDPELLATNANLTEYPSVVCGGFDEAFLSIPDPVLITAMKSHQKYFAVHGEEGRLMPNFVAVNNTLTKDPDVVRRGHERVLRARLSDAGFFFREDRKRPLEDRLEDLKGVIYQAELGTSYAKVMRFSRLAEFLGKALIPDRLEDIRTAAHLCKCDLVTLMVGEFPSLQGTMGEAYASLEGYSEDICAAVREHYLPERAGGALPAGELGAVVGVADRMDTIVGCFAVGLEPTGSADPFALRRHALAVIRIAEAEAWDISLNQLTETALDILSDDIPVERKGLQGRVVDFFRERFRNLMLRSGYETDLVEAVIAADFDRIPKLRSRCEALKRFADESVGFLELAVTFKRVTNILKKQDAEFKVNPQLFKSTFESDLWEACKNLKDDVARCVRDGAYYEALGLLATLKGPVDGFFDGVEVLTKESRELRENRVGLLQELSGLLSQVADFSKFS